ncbi:hypothetical protein GOBAR_AA38590 [Gossypium barbadense]|uniref:Uncharacterized protein n=1 Tax=Gossypium barbadense TaxID=3634 RepID=A0A2P5VTH0_GOSBA|nr:hypothetical protein GOBAR_AA38590 [Gossypium barbadense]
MELKGMRTLLDKGCIDLPSEKPICLASRWYLSRAGLDSLHFANGSCDRDLLLDVPSKGSFIPAGRTASSYFEVLGNRQGLVVAQ